MTLSSTDDLIALAREALAKAEGRMIRDHLRHFDWRTFFAALFASGGLFAAFSTLSLLIEG